MKIGIDCRTILNPGFGEAGGVGHYTYYLVKYLLKVDQKNQYVLFFDDRVVETSEFERPNTTIKLFPYSKYGVYLPYAYSQMLIAAFLQREKLDVYHSPANVIPSYYKGTTVQTVHDLSVFTHSEWYPSKWLSRHTLAWKTLFPSSIKRADRVIALSHSLAHELQTLFHLPSERITVIPGGFDVSGPHATANHPEFESVARKYQIEHRYVLFVGTIEPRKNLKTLVKAFERVLKEYPEKTKGLQLVIAGKGAHGLSGVQREIEMVNRRYGMEIVKYLGYVLHEEKVCLLKHAVGFVSVSLYEGFGMPAIEAMGLGCPVLVSNSTAFPEVVADAGLYCDPTDLSSIVEGLVQLVDEDGRGRRIALGRARASEFAWEPAARRTLECYVKLDNK